MRRTFPFLAAALIALLGGVAYGLRTDRWSISGDLQEAAARVADVPLSFGDWEGHDQKIDRRELAMAGIVGYASRRYENRRDGTAVGVLIVCGRPGPISVHTPDICYAGVGYELAGSPDRVPLTYAKPRRAAETMWADFVKQGAVVPTQMRIFWAWSTGGPWKAPENPRLAHASHGALYKLYVTHETPGPAGPVGEGRGFAFLQAFLPELDRALTRPPAKAVVAGAAG